jgi:hypothetical protein
MPRYLVHRTFPEGLVVPIDHNGAESARAIIAGNAQHGVTWITSYVSPDKHTTFCIYDGPNAASIQEAAETTELPFDSLTEVSVLDPYFYH